MSEYTYYSDPLRKLSLYQGITTADGAGDGSTLVCSDLVNQDEDYDGNHVIITSGTYRNARDINGTTLGGTVTFTSALKGQIVKGTTFMILGFRTTPAEVAALQADITTLLSRLSALRAGYLDELDFDLDARLGSPVASVSADIATIDGIVDNILSDTQLKFAVSGSKTIATGVEKYLNIDSGTDGAEIISITLKGVPSAAWSIELYVPTDDGVTSPAAGDKRAKEMYTTSDHEGGHLVNIGAIRYNLFLDITNDSASSDNIDEVMVSYRSRGTVTATWE